MIRINLLPRAPRRRLPVPQVTELVIPVVVLVLVVAVSFWINRQTAGLEDQIARANQEIQQLRPVVARVEELDKLIAEMKKKEDVVADLLKQQLPAASVLNEVRLLIPKEVWMVSLSVPDPSSINMEGLARDHYAVARLMDNLASGQIFKRVDLTVMQLEKVGAVEVVRFQVTATIAKPQAAGGGR
jgi:type IV pilus assembly protein PilN